MFAPYVNLYGWNIDAEKLKEELKFSIGLEGKEIDKLLQKISPVVISTACAGISHQEKNFRDLREKYRDLEKMVNLDEKLVKMGHKSIVEHMNFNFDIILTRIAIEKFEKFRLASYTEKSQRFTEVDSNAFFIPESSYSSEIENLAEKQIYAYKDALEKGIAKEDARMILMLCFLGPLNFTVNGRELEYMIQRMKSDEFEELVKAGEFLENEIENKIPEVKHLIKYTQKDHYYQKNKELEEYFKNIFKKYYQNRRRKNLLVSIDREADNKILEAMMFKEMDLDYNDCSNLVNKMSLEEKKEAVKIALKHMELWHDAPRAFETAYLRFSAPISASCFAQLKRHRMMTLITQEYLPELGYTIPQSIKDADMNSRYISLIKQSSNLYQKMLYEQDPNAPYVITNAHKRRVFVEMNFRELYHFSRLREDKHAQWHIKDLATRVVNSAKDIAPITTILLGGKDKFDEIKKEVYE